MSDSTADQIDDEDDEESGLEAAFLVYRDAGLRLPPVPRELAPRVREYGEWHYGTRETNPTDRAGFLAAARSVAPEAEVAFGHFGHGVASWYLCYRLLLDPLAVFVHQRFGNMDEDQDNDGTRLINATAASLEEVVVLAEVARLRGKVPVGQRLIVVIDDRDGDFWQLSPNGEPQAGDHVLFDAMAFLRAPA